MAHEEMLEIVKRNEDICFAMVGAMKAWSMGSGLSLPRVPTPFA